MIDNIDPTKSVAAPIFATAESSAFYITTPIYYVNGAPHVGSATTTLLCDCLARYHRLNDHPTFFLTGTDENAQKVADAAGVAGQDTQQFVDSVSRRYRETWDFLHISQDDFIRTSEMRHRQAAEEVFRQLQERGAIYPGEYEGWYSVADETFFRDAEIRDGQSIETGATVERVTEPVYYFKLSAFSERLLAHIENNKNFLLPDTRRNEVIAFIKDGLRDVAVSRRNTGWGIEVPGDATQVIYVWFDALINYLTATGWPDDPNWKSLWPANVHLVGKEIYTRFHATLWPAMLMALDLPLPCTVLGHGWWLVAGEKGSKSKGNIPTPQEAVKYLAERSGATTDLCVDALRYYLLRDISFTGDSEFSYGNWEARYNDFLANKLGNLLNRSLNMLHQFADGIVPDSAERTRTGAFAIIAQEVIQDVEREMLALNPAGALESIWRLAKAANEDVDTQAPWRRHKEGDAQGVADALYTTLEATRLAAVLLQPFLPTTSMMIRQQLGLGDTPVEAWAVETQWGRLPAGLKTQTAQPLFPRIDNKKPASGAASPQNDGKKAAAALKEQKTTMTPAAETATLSADVYTIGDFQKAQIRVGEIKAAERIEGAKKLLKLSVDVGEGAERQLVAGIAESYSPEDLPGRKIVVLVNLQPATIRGVLSQGMLLAATDPDGKAVLLTPDNVELEAGAKIK